MNSYVYKDNLKGERVWGKLLAVYCACLIISNVLAARVFCLGPFTLPCAVVIFPVVYIINDLMAEIFPLAKVRKGIMMAFILNAVAVLFYEIAILLPGYGDTAFAEVLGSSWRVLIASFIAYLVGSNLNALVMNKMHNKFGEKGLFFRCMLSTVVGEFLDALIFITIAFYGTMDNQTLLTMIIAQACFKIAYELVVFPLTGVIINKTKKALI